MDVAPCITREIEVEVGPDELWSLLADGGRWTEWLVDEGAPDVRPGGGGTVVDDGERRQVRVDTVVEGERVVFEWWYDGATDGDSPDDTPDATTDATADGTGWGRTLVELEIVHRGDRTALRVTETPRAACSVGAAADHAARWDLRLLVLHLAGCALART